ncbi:MAG: AAA family ATPase [Bauldia sp.]
MTMHAPALPAPDDQSETLAFLGESATHGGHEVTRIDTHGAIVFLAGDRAVKLKRAVKFPFLDFTTVDRRKAACDAEIRVNRPAAPDIYLGVEAITRNHRGELAIDGPGTVIDHVVIMRRFDETQTLDRLAANGMLTTAIVPALAEAVLASHRAAALHDGAPWLRQLGVYLDQNEAAFAEYPELFPVEAVARLSAASRATLAALVPLVERRGRLGFVRRCHGDLHLRNIVLIDGRPTLFDAIEFDEAIAISDVFYDLAFLLMDLWHRGLRAEANDLFNRYVAATGDDHIDGLALLPLFISIRAGIRAKVTAATIAHGRSEERAEIAREAGEYFELACAVMASPTPRLVAIGGLSGTGKSTLAAALAPLLGGAPGALLLRSDVERKALFGVAETERLGSDAYAAAVTADVYERIQRKARIAIEAGRSVILDAVHARPEERAEAETVAAALGVPFDGLWLEAPEAELVARVTARTGDASDADAAIVLRQLEYDVGSVGWHRVDAHGGADAVAERARAALRLAG